MKKKRLSDINISYISLVKNGANGREVIFKSSVDTPSYEKIIKLSKEEKGVVYGIVYEPEVLDSQGDIASAEEIEKAAYDFMKARNTRNVDKNHDFNATSAYVAESWIVKSGDALFPDAIGAWAVGIKLEDEALKEQFRKGELAGLSMAGIAKREEEKDSLVKSMFEQIMKALTLQKTQDATNAARELEQILKAAQESQSALESAKAKIAILENEASELRNELRKSAQNTNPQTLDAQNPEAIAKAARAYVLEQERAGISVSVSEAVAIITKGAKI